MVTKRRVPAPSNLVAWGDGLGRAHRDVGGELVSAGGTGSYDLNELATENQAGSHVLMDTACAKLGLPFRQALYLWTTVLSVSGSCAVCDGGPKSLGTDRGNPELPDGAVWFCSGERITFGPSRPLRVGDKVRVIPAHVDPTVALHERLHLVDAERVLDTWVVDLRGW